MSEHPPPERRESFVFDPERAPPSTHAPPRDRAAAPARGVEGPVSQKAEKHELLGQTVGGRYRIRGVLGEGGMGTVYDAEHLGLSRQVAIKVLSPTQAKKRVAVKRFQQEARAAGAIGHPNICEVYDLGLLDDGSPYLVMEKLVGQTLAERIAKEGGLPFEDVVEVIVQVLSGLIAAHEKGIVHRDIKPENIFLARRVGAPAVIKLLDFGVSKMLPEFQNGEDFDLTRTGMVMGTPYYMSPEQARGERNLDGRVDVYACGVVMYEALAGKRPFLAPNYNALLLSIINSTPKPLRDVRPKTPPELEAIIARAMAKNRDDRYASAKHLLRELAPVPVAEGSGARLPAPPTAEERKRAPILGGGRRADPSDRGRPSAPGSRRSIEPLDRPDSPSATLHSRMAEASRGSRGGERASFDATSRGGRPPGLMPAHPIESISESNDAFDIPIHVTAPEQELQEDDPTQFFHPSKHPSPRLPPPSRSTPASHVPADRPSRPSRSGRPDLRPPSPPESVSRTEPSRHSPSDEWDGETIVNRPDSLPPFENTPPRQRRPFNPDETVKLDGKSDIEFLDDATARDRPSSPGSRQAPPRRR